MKKVQVFFTSVLIAVFLCSIFGSCKSTPITVVPVVLTQTDYATVIVTQPVTLSPTTITSIMTATTTTTLPVQTIIVTSTPPATTVTATVTALPILVNLGVPITSHTLIDINGGPGGNIGYYSLCLYCHGQGAINAAPYAGTWDATATGSIHYTGKFTVVAGSPADHTKLTSFSSCTLLNCHAAPTS